MVGLLWRTVLIRGVGVTVVSGNMSRTTLNGRVSKGICIGRGGRYICSRTSVDEMEFTRKAVYTTVVRGCLTGSRVCDVQLLGRSKDNLVRRLGPTLS